MIGHRPVKGLREVVDSFILLVEENGADTTEVKLFMKEYKEREPDERAHIFLQALFTICLAEDENWLGN